MSFDSRLRDELRQAADVHDLREEDALQRVKSTQPTDWADFTVVTLEESDSPRARHARTQRLVGVLAACALLAGAVALPVALRSRSRAAARPAAASVTRSSTCGPPVSKGYRSTAVLRVAAAPSVSTPSTTSPSIELAEPAQFALGICNSARARSHLRSAPGIGFDAATNASGDLLSLTVVTPTRAGTTALARNWASEFAVARRAEAKGRIRAQQLQLTLRVQKLHRQLKAVDTQLARLMPAIYGGVLSYDAGINFGRQPPPPVPEVGVPHELNLAFERIQILSQLTHTGERAASLRIAAVQPDVFASVVSQTPAVSIHPPHHDTDTSAVLIAVGLLTGGVLLAGSAFWLGRRRRAPN